jgi:hypothetical protein
MMASLQSGASIMQHVVLIMFAMIIFCVVGSKVLSDNPRPVFAVLPFLLLGLVFTMQPQILVNLGMSLINLFTGVEDSKPAHDKSNDSGWKIHISTEDWIYAGVTLAVCIVLTLLFFAIKKYIVWYNSPEKVEARAVAENETLQRIREGIADNPDIMTLNRLINELSARKSSQATELLAEAKAERTKLEEAEERAALTDARDELADIKQRNATLNKAFDEKA